MTTLLPGRTAPTPLNPPLRRETDFVPGHLSSATEFWETEIFADSTEEERQRITGSLRRVSLYQFIDPKANGESLGKSHNGDEISPAAFKNHVPAEFEP